MEEDVCSGWVLILHVQKKTNTQKKQKNTIRTRTIIVVGITR